MKPSEILTEGKKRIEAAKTWKPGDTAFAMSGVAKEHADYMKALFFLRAAVGIGPEDPLFAWDKGANKKAVLGAYDQAIEFALSQETADVG